MTVVWRGNPGSRRELHGLKSRLRRLGLRTVCEHARCPNIHDCFGRGTATFLILGPVCTRACRFCSVRTGLPAAPDPGEPAALVEAVRGLSLSHAVVTSVTRDDLPDRGAGHFAACVAALSEALPEVAVEILTPDFGGDPGLIALSMGPGVQVFNHNVETVPRLYPAVRPGADYQRSLSVLAAAAGGGRCAHVKSGLMVGLGETDGEVAAVLADLRLAGVGIVTIGQYLQPGAGCLPVAEHVPQARFDAWRDLGLGLGFSAVASGPFVRSSYRAAEVVPRPDG